MDFESLPERCAATVGRGERKAKVPSLLGSGCGGAGLAAAL